MPSVLRLNSVGPLSLPRPLSADLEMQSMQIGDILIMYCGFEISREKLREKAAFARFV